MDINSLLIDLAKRGYVLFSHNGNFLLTQRPDLAIKGCWPNNAYNLPVNQIELDFFVMVHSDFMRSFEPESISGLLQSGTKLLYWDKGRGWW